jgi:hypothetical protein
MRKPQKMCALVHLLLCILLCWCWWFLLGVWQRVFPRDHTMQLSHASSIMYPEHYTWMSNVLCPNHFHVQDMNNAWLRHSTLKKDMKFYDHHIVMWCEGVMDDLKFFCKMLCWKVYVSHCCTDYLVSVLNKMSLAPSCKWTQIRWLSS